MKIEIDLYQYEDFLKARWKLGLLQGMLEEKKNEEYGMFNHAEIEMLCKVIAERNVDEYF